MREEELDAPGASRFTGVFETTVGSTIRPGDPGTAKLVRDWRDRPVCVRYRYNAQRKMRVKTAEIVVDEVAWTREADAAHGIEIRNWEGKLREAIVAAGGRWD